MSQMLSGALTSPPPSQHILCYANAKPSGPLSLPRRSQSLSLFNTRFRDYHMKKNRRRRGFGVVCYSAQLTPSNIQWISTISSAVLMLAKGTAVQKSFLVPLLVLQAPTGIVSWIKGEYGAWTAFFALLVRLFYFIPGELELPFMAMLLVTVAPYQVMNLRGTQAGATISLVIAAYLAFQHFSRLGSLQRAFDQGSAVSTLAVIFITAASCFLMI